MVEFTFVREDASSTTPPAAIEFLVELAESPRRVDLVVDALRAGATYYEVAKATGVDESTARRRWYIGPRPPGARERWDVSDDEVLELHEMGWSNLQVALRLECSISLVRCRLWKHGIGSDPHASRKAS